MKERRRKQDAASIHALFCTKKMYYDMEDQ
jgi:hypothetical protein